MRKQPYSEGEYAYLPSRSLQQTSGADQTRALWALVINFTCSSFQMIQLNEMMQSVTSCLKISTG